MVSARLNVPTPANEPVLNYAPGSAERDALSARLKQMSAEQVEIPIIIGGEEVKSDQQFDVVCPHDHGHVLAKVHAANAGHVAQAAKASAEAWKQWSEMDWQARVSVFLRAAELLAGSHRMTLNAATMLGQGKTCYQAEIDSACELIDFLRFNCHFTSKLISEQPESSAGIWNYLDHRPLEGFIFAITPFNFTAIAGNLSAAPAMLGNVTLWKPSKTATLSGYYLMKLFEEAGLPPGVINFLPGDGRTLGAPALAHPDLAGVHFTGSTPTFQHIWRTVGENISNYKSYPRLVGETGGKDFVVAHQSADPEQVTTALLRGAFEYQGQKCSAASRAYLPKSLYAKMRDSLIEETRNMTMGDPANFENFVGAVIDKKAFTDIKGYIDYARESADGKIVVGGECDDSKGYFIRPTIVETDKTDFKLMREEIFGPVLTVYVYEDNEFDNILTACDQGSPYALTGAVFAQDRAVIEKASTALRHAAGNFYINDKPTGAVVGQQPFGGGRASGTNDKAGSVLNLLRWVSPRNIKETFDPPRDYRYPFLAK